MRDEPGAGDSRGHAALAGSPDLEALKRAYEGPFLDKCRQALAPFAAGGDIDTAGLRALVGAAEALSQAAACGEFAPEAARQELQATIVAMVGRR